tara:strand:- start:2289 stop:3302 length:1014 start_codon:yes stop_codon:yes gene_type:complete
MPEYKGKKVKLNKPKRISKGQPGYGKKKFYVYVKNEKGNVIRLTFGDPNLEIKRDSDKRRKNFRARHNCAKPGPKYKARYWSCKMWERRKSVTDYTKGIDKLTLSLKKLSKSQTIYNTDDDQDPFPYPPDIFPAPAPLFKCDCTLNVYDPGDDSPSGPVDGMPCAILQGVNTPKKIQERICSLSYMPISLPDEYGQYSDPLLTRLRKTCERCCGAGVAQSSCQNCHKTIDAIVRLRREVSRKCKCLDGPAEGPPAPWGNFCDESETGATSWENQACDCLTAACQFDRYVKVILSKEYNPSFSYEDGCPDLSLEIGTIVGKQSCLQQLNQCNKNTTSR